MMVILRSRKEDYPEWTLDNPRLVKRTSLAADRVGLQSHPSLTAHIWDWDRRFLTETRILEVFAWQPQ